MKKNSNNKPASNVEATKDVAGFKEYKDFIGGMLLEKLNPITRPLWEEEVLFINPFKPVPPVQTWCRMGKRPALPKDGLITFSAKQKQGKSLSTYALLIPLLTGDLFDTITPIEKPQTVIVIDMEMSQTTLTNRLNAQLKALKNPRAPFYVASLKATPLNKRLNLIETLINRYNPDIVVIDQVAKLILNGNDIEGSNRLVDTLDRWSQHRSIWCVMHENKGTEDNNMKGHLGSYLSYAATEAYQVSRKSGVFTVTPKEARDTDTDGAEEVRFILDAEGVIKPFGQLTDKEAEEQRRKQVAEYSNMFSFVFGLSESLNYGELVEFTKKQHNLGGNGAKQAIVKAIQLGVIKKTGEGKRDPYSFNPSIMV